MSDSLQPHRRQPTRLPCPWDSLGKNTGVGCHFLLQCMKVKSESEVAQSCPTLCHPMDCVAHQAPPSMGFSRQEDWSGVPLPSLMDGVGSCKQLLTTCTHPLSTSPMLVHNWGPGVVTGAPGWMANSEFIPQLSAFRGKMGKIKFSGKISCLWKKKEHRIVCKPVTHLLL